MNTSVTIIGGGIAGLTTAIALQKIGINCAIFEASPQPRALGAGIMLAANAMQAFQRIGIAEKAMQKGQLLSALAIKTHTGKIISTTETQFLTEKYGAHNFAIHRADLHTLLLECIENPQIHTNKRAISFTQTEKSVIVHFQDGTSHETNYVIVADGIHSALRRQILPESKPRYAGYTCWRAVVDIPTLKLKEGSETWGREGRFGIVPLKNNQIYWFACINAPQNSEKMKNYKVADLQAVFKAFHQPIPEILAHTKEADLIWNDIIDLKPIQNYAFGRVLLIGDAAHATTPNMGQGACQAIEDAILLANQLKITNNMSEAFQLFSQKRQKRTHYIVNTSWTLGKIAQLENPILISFRNFFLSKVPNSVNQQQMAKLFEVDF
ncbi:MAG: FAD-dependent monooxygenase [Bacteroidia bacterium]